MEEEIEKLQKEIEEIKKQRDEYLGGWQRARADFLNYKREEMERMKELMEVACENLILQILPILDNFDIGEKNLPDDLKKNESVKGLLQVKVQLQNFLKSQGVQAIESMGKKFDPNVQEAVGEIEKEGMESGMVIEEVQKGYIRNGRLLRPAKGKVVKFKDS